MVRGATWSYILGASLGVWAIVFAVLGWFADAPLNSGTMLAGCFAGIFFGFGVALEMMAPRGEVQQQQETK